MRPMYKWKDRGRGCEAVDWIYMTQDRVHKQALVNMMNPHVPLRWGTSLSQWLSGSLFYGIICITTQFHFTGTYLALFNYTATADIFTILIVTSSFSRKISRINLRGRRRNLRPPNISRILIQSTPCIVIYFTACTSDIKYIFLTKWCILIEDGHNCTLKCK